MLLISTSVIGGTVNCSRNYVSFTCPPCIAVGGGNLSHSPTQSLSSVPVTGGPSMQRPRSTTTSCNVTVISPSRRWNVDISGLHLSIRAVSNGRSSLTQVNLDRIKNTARETYSMTRTSVSSQCFSDLGWSKNFIIPRSCRFANKWVRTKYNIHMKDKSTCRKTQCNIQ